MQHEAVCLAVGLASIVDLRPMPIVAGELLGNLRLSHILCSETCPTLMTPETPASQLHVAELPPDSLMVLQIKIKEARLRCNPKAGPRSTAGTQAAIEELLKMPEDTVSTFLTQGPKYNPQHTYLGFESKSWRSLFTFNF